MHGAPEVTTNEIADGVFRINVAVGSGDVSCFLVRDGEAAMVETGLGQTFPLVLDAVQRLVDPSTLRYIFIPCFAMDECGALSQFLDVAPAAQPVCSPAGAISYLDYCGRPPTVLGHGQRLAVGDRAIVGAVTPWAPAWDSMVFFDEPGGVLFGADLFCQATRPEAVTDEDRTAEMLAFYRVLGTFPSQPLLDQALDRIEALDVRVLAGMHGPALAGDPHRYYKALREGGVAGLLDAPFYAQTFDLGDH